MKRIIYNKFYSLLTAKSFVDYKIRSLPILYNEFGFEKDLFKTHMRPVDMNSSSCSLSLYYLHEGLTVNPCLVIPLYGPHVLLDRLWHMALHYFLPSRLWHVTSNVTSYPSNTVQSCSRTLVTTLNERLCRQC